jgi:Cu2+-containing amine oxidase
MRGVTMKLVIPAFLLLFIASSAGAAVHPLEPLSAEEHRAAYDAVRGHFAAAADLPHENLTFPFVELREPPKSVVSSWNGGATFTREATVHVMHAPSNRVWIATVDVAGGHLSRLQAVAQGASRR